MDEFATTLNQLSDSGLVHKALESRSSGLGVGSVSERITGAAQQLLKTVDGNRRAVAAYAPGRIEFLGKHTDYAGGQSLTCAVRRAFCMVAAPADQPGLSLEDLVTGMEAFVPYAVESGEKPANWVRYPGAVTKRIITNFGAPDSGIAIVFSSDIPRASGMSSSSAFVVGIWLCMAALSEIDLRPAFQENITRAADLADFLGCVENGAPYRNLAGDMGVGTKGGAQDHTAILYSSASTLGHYGYRPLRRLGRITLPPDLSFVVASSGVHASKSTGALKDYNNAVTLAEHGTRIWNDATGANAITLEDVVSSSAFSLESFLQMVREVEPDMLKQEAIGERTRQFVHETREIIPQAMHALASGDYDQLGFAVAESQRIADRGLRNHVPETRFLAESAVPSGAIAASAFGAGFGGSVYAVVRKAEAESFLKSWMVAYGSAFGHRLRKACFFSDPTGCGAFVLGADPVRMLLEPQL